MPEGIAITHADLAPRPRHSHLASKTGAVVVLLTILCGLACFVLCLIAEDTRSEVTWISTNDSKEKEVKYECTYSGSGKTPLLWAAGAFVGLAVAMVMEHTYMLVAVSKTPPPALVTWEPDPGYAKSITRRAAVLFVSTWVCFAVGEILLLIGLSVESGHLKNWSKPRPACLVMREGIFSAAGVFALATVLLAAGLHFTVLQALKKFEEIEKIRREVLEAATALYPSQPASPRYMTSLARENPVRRDDQIGQTIEGPPQVYTKQCNLV